MIVVGLTGGIGMGKSRAAAYLKEQKIPVFEADAYIHRALNKGGRAVAHVARVFPKTFLSRQKKIDRAALAAIITGHVDQRKKLEAILHPLVRAAEERFIRRHNKAGAKLIVLDIPLLFETGAEALCDVVLCVTAAPEIQRARVLARPGMTDARFKDILRAQMKNAVRVGRADYVVDTGQDWHQTRRDLQSVLTRIKQAYARNRSGHRNHGA